MNLLELTKEKGLKTEEDCIAYLERMRWPDGIRCPACGNLKISRFQAKGKTGKVRHLYQCLEKSCRYQFSATTGTIFHDSHLPLMRWFEAVALVSESKEAISANQLRHALEIQYKTARHVLTRIQQAMQKGTVEVEPTPGVSLSHPQARPAPPQSVLVMPKRKGPRRNRMVSLPRENALAVAAKEHSTGMSNISNNLAANHGRSEAPPTTVDNLLSLFTAMMEMTVRPPLFWFNYLIRKVSPHTEAG